MDRDPAFLTLTLRQSRLEIVVMAVLHVVAAGSALTVLPVLPGLVLLGGIGFSALRWRYWRGPASLRRPRQLLLGAVACRLRCGDERECAAGPVRLVYLSELLLILRLPALPRPQRELLIWPDTLSGDDHRRLRRWLARRDPG